MENADDSSHKAPRSIDWRLSERKHIKPYCWAHIATLLIHCNSSDLSIDLELGTVKGLDGEVESVMKDCGHLTKRFGSYSIGKEWAVKG